MASGTVAEAVAAMGGRLLQGDPEAKWSGAALDSRQVEGGELFFALPGEMTDGHLFAESSLDRGAAAAVIEREEVAAATGALILVEDSLAALHALTRHVRKRLPKRLVAITGSAGKTTTKELLAAMLSSRYNVARNPGNLNNLFGFPLSLLGVDEGTEWMVAEMGMSTPGELRRLAALGRPDIVIYTNVRPVHLEFFENLAGIAEAKAELMEGLDESGTVVANAGDPEVVRIVSRHSGAVIWYGLETSAGYSAHNVSELPEGGTSFELRIGDQDHPVELSLYGRYNIENFLAAAACAHTIGIPVEEIVAAAASAEPASMRGVVHPLPGGGHLVDDSYNSNPDALARSLASARALGGVRYWAVLGSMLELGRGSEDFHRQAGREAVRLGFDPVVVVGREARPLAAGVEEAGGRALWAESAADAVPSALAQLERGDVVLVKGSRGVGLDRVVEKLLAGGSA